MCTKSAAGLAHAVIPRTFEAERVLTLGSSLVESQLRKEAKVALLASGWARDAEDPHATICAVGAKAAEGRYGRWVAVGAIIARARYADAARVARI